MKKILLVLALAAWLPSAKSEPFPGEVSAQLAEQRQVIQALTERIGQLSASRSTNVPAAIEVHSQSEAVGAFLRFSGFGAEDVAVWMLVISFLAKLAHKYFLSRTGTGGLPAKIVSALAVRELPAKPAIDTDSTPTITNALK